MFEFLFKYRPIAFEEGQITLGAPSWMWVAVIIALALGSAATVSYAFAKGKTNRRDRILLSVCRVALFGAVAFCLLQPTLVISTVAPQQNFVGVLFDDSRSMGLADVDGSPRGSLIQEHFAVDSELTPRLSERFSLRHFRFAANTSRIEGPERLTFDGTRTDIASALETATAELAGIPLAGLVLVSDGAANTSSSLTDALIPLQATGVPVFTVGVGEEVISPDIELGRVEMPRAALQGSSLFVDVIVTQRGLRDGSRVPLVVEDEIRVLASEEIELGADGDPVVARVPIRLDRVGPHAVTFRIAPQQGERVTENNQRTVHLDVRGGREKVLYFEGEPRFEVKFMRRAVADDDNLQLVVLQRTAESKFLRLDVDDGSELEFGFPSERRELYRYRALVLGSVEASFFTHDQLNMIADFVSERGGGLLLLGGGRSFAEGGWTGTPVEEVIPVLMSQGSGGGAGGTDTPESGPAEGIKEVTGDGLESNRTGPFGPADRFFAEVKVRPTQAGLNHPSVRLDADPGAVAERWEALPPVTLVNPVSAVRPGATVLLTGNTEVLSGAGWVGPENENVEQAVLSFQRYGRGKAIALTIQDSWLWQMHADVPVDDMAHEMFWQQMIRWLVDGVPEPVRVVAERERVEPGENVRIVTVVADSTYAEVNGASVAARVTAPSGVIQETPAEWTVERDGEYAFSFNPTELGEYEVEVSAQRDGEALGTARTYLVAARSDEEYFAAGQDAAALRDIAEETGGRHYTAQTLSTLPEDIELSGAGVTLVDRLDLWDMPVLFFLVLALMGFEWGWRRRRGLA